MKKVIYFHGLESQQGGKKTDYLINKFLVHAPAMDYTKKQTWTQTQQKVKNIKPQIICGSSMGGLMAFLTSYSLQSNLLLFNPAFDHIDKYIPDFKCNGLNQKSRIKIILGKFDSDVDPSFTIKYLNDNNIKFEVQWLDMEHRIQLDIFKECFDRSLSQFKL